MNFLKAIETYYKGYRFRSRLEARWAVFLDTIEARWEYEKEGFDINGVWYLPDFWLPMESMPQDARGWGSWIEIKPEPLSADQINLLAGLAKNTGHRVYALCGQPWPGEYKVTVFQHSHAGEPSKVPHFSDGEIIEVDSHIGTEFEGLSTYLEIAHSGGQFPCFEGEDFRALGSGALQRAFRAARSARFEHGEKGGAS